MMNNIERNSNGEIIKIFFNIKNDFLNWPRVFVKKIENKKHFKIFDEWEVTVLSKVTYDQTNVKGDLLSKSKTYPPTFLKEAQLIKYLSESVLRELKHHVSHEAEECLYLNDKRVGDPHPIFFEEKIILYIENNAKSFILKFKELKKKLTHDYI